jgi:hypothetical protein
VCSTLRPTRLAHLELRGHEGIARFVAEFLALEALADAVQPPAHLASPASVLAWQVRMRRAQPPSSRARRPGVAGPAAARVVPLLHHSHAPR